MKPCTISQDLSVSVATNREMVDEACSLLQSAFAPVLYDELSRSLQELHERASRANVDIVCWFSQRKMVACLQVEWHGDYVHGNLLGVHQDHRGEGIPWRILGWLEEECRRRRIAMIEFETLEDWQSHHRFYQRLGFIKGESFNRYGVHYRKLRKLVTPLTMS